MSREDWMKMNEADNEAAWEEFHRWPIPRPNKASRVRYRTLTQVTLGVFIGGVIIVVVNALINR